MYIELLKEIHQQLDDNSPPQRKQRDQHQERSTTGRYRIAQALYGSTRKLTWETRRLKIDGEYLSHLRFADDILICANTPHDLQQMPQEFTDDSENQGLKMNKSKTMVMMENGTPIYVNNTQIENVESFIYLGQRYSTRDKPQDKERRFKKESRADGQHSPSTATSSRVTLEHVSRDKSTIHAYFQQ